MLKAEGDMHSLAEATRPCSRRLCLLALVGSVLTLQACASPRSQLQNTPERFGLSTEDEALFYKFRDIPKGGNLRVDATYQTDMRQTVYLPNGELFSPVLGNIGKGGQNSAYIGDEKHGLPLPKYLRYQRFSKDIARPLTGHPWYKQGYDGPPEVDVIVPVATRIPDEVLDRIRKYRGGLKLKLRLTPETILVGWQVQNGKNYPWRKDQNGRAYATDEDVMIGGDFCEKQIIYRMVDGKIQQVVRKGWQIDPRTGRKTETDF